MGRWSHLDSDEERLPSGMTRVGYDADTQVYTFRDASDGSYWEGAPGCRYGKLHRVRAATPPLPSITVPAIDDGDEAPYILHDPDVPSDEDDYSDLDQGFSEKHGISTLTSPDKARVHTPHPHPALLNDLPSSATSINEKETLRTSRRLSGTTLASITTTSTTPSLKRSGTLSRLARFLSSSHPPPSSSGRRTAATLSRRATVAGEPADGSARHSKGSRLSRASTAAAGEMSQWPAPREPRRTRKRATTFDEILGGQQ